MDIHVKRKSATSTPTPKKREGPPSLFRIGEHGRVKELHSADNTVDVLLDSGVFLKHVQVKSNEWVIYQEDSEKDFNAGGRDLPPLHARVFVLMPSGTYSDCFVLCSLFSTPDKAEPFLADEKEKIQERITPSGWHTTKDNVTGSYKAVSPDEKTSLEIDYGNEDEPKEDKPELHLNLFDEIKADIVADDNVHLSVFEDITIDHKKDDSCTMKVFDTELVIKKGEVSIKPKETTIEVDGNATIKTSGDTKIEATGDVAVKGSNVKVEATANADIKGANVTVDASALLTLKTGDAAAYCPNIMPACPLGPIHGGVPAGIIKLKGA